MVLCWTLVGVVHTSHARAIEAEVQSTTDAQFYTLSSPYGDPLIRRRRYTQTLGLAVYDIGGDSVGFGPRLSFKMRMRLDSDFGQEGVERSPNSAGRFIPGLEQSPVDVMYAYLEGERYLGGWLGFRVGRQYTTDALGWWSFDGGLVRLTTPVYFQAEAYGGFEQRGGLPALLATSRYTADGVYRGNRSELEANQYPYYLEESKLAPAYGFALESSGVSWIHGRLSYRKVINRDTVVVSPFADAGGGFVTVGGDRVSSERIGYSARLSAESLGAVRGSVVYDFVNQLFSEHALAADWYATEKLTVGADYDYYYPTFDADSIFNWFTHEATTTYLGRAEYRASRRFDVALSGGARVFRTEGDSATYASTFDRSESGMLTDVLGNAGGRYRWRDGSVELRSMGETGKRGHRVGGDVTTRQAFDYGLYDAMVVLSLYDWNDDLRSQRDATSFGYVLGGGYSPLERTRLGLEWEHSMNRLVGQRYRVLATLDVTVLK
ncbi:MAG: hypothetical protein KC776_31530 [Myxococcales bacterium]|nr:hypothetical protein [Myxococcales bacterium]MCB9579429.1 hypothetical protein [Polyangiaceae bacterium]